MFNEVNSTLGDGIRSIDALLKNLNDEKEHTPTRVPIAPCVKLVLLQRAKPSDQIFSSLLDELNGQLRSLIGQYFYFLEQKYAACLFDSVSRAVRSLLSHVQDLLRAIETREEQSLNYMAGMITKISEEVEKIPIGNKLAYRMHFMEKCLLVKQTFDEFKSYVEEARAKQLEEAEEEEEEEETESAVDGSADNLAQGVTNIKLSAEGVTAEDATQDSDSDFDDDCEDELDYTARETTLVESCVRLIGKTLGALKNSLLTITAVCDATHSISATVTVFNAPAEQQAAARAYSQQWVAQLAFLAQMLYKEVLDLGAELYPPFEADTSKIQELFAALRAHCADYLRLVQAEALLAYQTEEGRARIAQLLHDVELCSLSL